MEISIILNPAAARGRVAQRLAHWQATLGQGAQVLATERAGHAEDLAFQAARAGCRIVAAAGGDGTLHEVANGVLRAANPEVTLAVLPLGSANDYAHSLGLHGDRVFRLDVDGPRRQVDVGSVRLEDGRERYFINTLGLGFSGIVAEESRRIHRFRGLVLYGLAFFRALRDRFACPLTEVRLDNQTWKRPTFSLTLAIGRREGNFVVAPNAQLDDGLFDYVYADGISRWQVLRFLPRIVLGKQLPADHPSLTLGQCKEAQVRAEVPLTVHLDGELLCVASDRVHSLTARILSGRLRVLA